MKGVDLRGLARASFCKSWVGLWVEGPHCRITRHYPVPHSASADDASDRSTRLQQPLKVLQDRRKSVTVIFDPPATDEIRLIRHSDRSSFKMGSLDINNLFGVKGKVRGGDRS